MANLILSVEEMYLSHILEAWIGVNSRVGILLPFGKAAVGLREPLQVIVEKTFENLSFHREPKFLVNVSTIKRVLTFKFHCPSWFSLFISYSQFKFQS